MTDIQKIRQADQDLIETWLYTAEKWGEAQADKYLHKVNVYFEKIGRGAVPLKDLGENIQYVRCEHHYIFLLAGKKPIVITILHERVDILARLKKTHWLMRQN